MSRQIIIGLLVAATLSGCVDGSTATDSASGATTVAAGTSSTPAAPAGPTISGTPLTSVVVGNAYSFAPTTSDPSGAALTFNVKNAPSWATFNSATGELSGTPTAADVSTYSNVTIGVSDGTTSVSLPAFQIAVTQIANGSATLSWAAPTENMDGTPLTNLAGYQIYYGTSAAAGRTFTLGAASTADAVSSTTIPLPAGNYATLSLLGAAAHGSQTNQSFVVTYTDDTTTTIMQSLSDWWGPPQNYAGESQVVKMPYLVTPTGATMNEVVYVYGYTFAINSAKTLKSITLPNNRNVMVLAIDVSASGATPVRVNLAAVDNVDGIANNGTAATNGGWDNSGYAYSAGLLGTSIAYAMTNAMTKTVQIANPGIDTYVVSNLSPGTWHFSIRAYTSANVESAASAAVSKTID
jgi:hypothetical protein